MPFTGTDYAILFVLTFPIALWAAWSDLKYMRIPNYSVLALALVFIVVAPFMLPFYTYLWALGLLLIVLVIAFLMETFGLIGAGDGKLAAAIAPFFVGLDIRLVLLLFTACMLAAYFTHRIVKHIPWFRKLVPEWQSWTSKQFPMGVALAGGLVIFLGRMVWLDFYA